MRSCVTDPRGERPLHTSWSALRTFNVAAAPDGSAASDSTEVSDGSEPPPDEGAPVQMEPPVRQTFRKSTLLLYQFFLKLICMI